MFSQYSLFLQKQRHLTCKFDYFLVPSIAATKLEIKSYFYDSEHDILLESRGMNLFIEILETKSQPLSYEAIFAVWLVVNYKFLCCGPHGLLLQVSKAMFCDHSQACIDMSIKLARLHSTHADFCFTDILKLKFI